MPARFLPHENLPELFELRRIVNTMDKSKREWAGAKQDIHGELVAQWSLVTAAMHWTLLICYHDTTMKIRNASLKKEVGQVVTISNSFNLQETAKPFKQALLDYWIVMSHCHQKFKTSLVNCHEHLQCNKPRNIQPCHRTIIELTSWSISTWPVIMSTTSLITPENSSLLTTRFTLL